MFCMENARRENCRKRTKQLKRKEQATVVVTTGIEAFISAENRKIYAKIKISHEIAEMLLTNLLFVISLFLYVCAGCVYVRCTQTRRQCTPRSADTYVRFGVSFLLFLLKLTFYKQILIILCI